MCQVRQHTTTRFTYTDDAPKEGDWRRNLDRFKEEVSLLPWNCIVSIAHQWTQNLKANLATVDVLKSIAAKKSVTPAQLSIAWVGALGPHVIPLPGAS